MKRKFAVAAATAALITASLSFTAFANKTDITKETPELAMAADDVKDIVGTAFNPAGDTWSIVASKDTTHEIKGSGFVKYNGKLYYVNKNGKFKLVEDGKYTVSAAEAEDDAATIYVKNGAQVKSQFITIDGKEYFIKANGTLEAGTAQDDGPEVVDCTVVNGSTSTTSTKLIADDGHVVKNWEKAKISGVEYWYYAKADGTAVQNTWVATAPTRWFFVGANGRLVTGAKDDASDAAAADAAKGIPAATVSTKNTAADGNRTITQGKFVYVVDKDGLWLNGWKFGADKKWYYYNTTGKMGWMKDGDKWVFLKDNYEAAMFEANPTGATGYAFDSNCYMIVGSGQVKASGNVITVYTDDKGVLRTGLKTIGSDKYYFEADSTAKAQLISESAKNIDVDGDNAKTGFFVTDKTGKILTNQWNKNDFTTTGTYKWYYLGKDGKAVTNSWVKYGESQCFMKTDGTMLDGGVYELDNDGKATTTPLSISDSDKGFALEAKLAKSVVIAENGVQVNDGWAILGKNADGTTKWGYAKNGKAYHGWLLYKGSWFYINAGVMEYNNYVDGGKYYVDMNGVWVVR